MTFTHSWVSRCDGGGGIVCLCVFSEEQWGKKTVETNVEKCMTFIEGNNSHFKAAKHVRCSVNLMCSDCRTIWRFHKASILVALRTMFLASSRDLA